MINNKCPCEECIALAICRHKGYMELFISCELVLEYDPKYALTAQRDRDHTKVLQEILNPTEWEYKYMPELDSQYPIIVPKGYTMERHERIQEWINDTSDKSHKVPM